MFRQPLQVDWLKLGGAPLLHTAGRVAISVCPGRPEMGQGLEADVARLKALHIDIVLSLAEESERSLYGAAGLGAALAAAGIGHLEYPLIDGLPPSDLGEARSVCMRILGQLGEGHNVLIHCIGGWGRSGTLAAALLCHEGHSPRRAIELVRRARSPRCVETMAQEVFVHKYAQHQRGFYRRYLFFPRAAIPQVLGGEPGQRRCNPSGVSLFVADTAEQLTRALIQVHHLHQQDEAWVVSGELPVEKPVPPGAALTVDRAYHISGTGLLPVPFSRLGQGP
ncbi:MAG: hypothetical protein RMK29_04665 [Myxococcales bacterium]|nr:hypothetical protein [Myxococcota bacterium]MDW8280982.1 hypothetical protein [Myxococcales bacterium]